MRVQDEPNLDPETAEIFGDNVIVIRPDPTDEPICDFCNGLLGRHVEDGTKVYGRPGSFVGDKAVCETCTKQLPLSHHINRVPDIREAVLKNWASQEGWN